VSTDKPHELSSVSPSGPMVRSRLLRSTSDSQSDQVSAVSGVLSSGSVVQISAGSVRKRDVPPFAEYRAPGLESQDGGIPGYVPPFAGYVDVRLHVRRYLLRDI
jgi:hypothetical protein